MKDGLLGVTTKLWRLFQFWSYDYTWRKYYWDCEIKGKYINKINVTWGWQYLYLSCYFIWWSAVSLYVHKCLMALGNPLCDILCVRKKTQNVALFGVVYSQILCWAKRLDVQKILQNVKEIMMAEGCRNELYMRRWPGDCGTSYFPLQSFQCWFHTWLRLRVLYTVWWKMTRIKSP